MGMQHPRKRLWINPPFQARFLLRIGSYFLLYLLLIWHLGFLVFLTPLLASAPAHKGFVELYVAYLGDLRPLFFATGVLAPYILYDLVKFSHRVAGPLYRCRRMMRDMAAGKPVSEFHPRKHDLMPEFFEDFNALINAWNARVAAGANGHPAPATPGEVPARQVVSVGATNGAQAHSAS